MNTQGLFLLCILIIVTAQAKNVCKSQPADIGFLLDESGSVGVHNFQQNLDFVRNFVDFFDIGATAVKISAFAFRTFMGDGFYFNCCHNKATIKSQINGIRYQGGGENFEMALAFARNNIFQKGNGMRDSSVKILIFFTDGQSGVLNGGQKLFDRGIIVYAVGVGRNTNRNQLIKIATNDSYVYQAPGYGSLLGQISIDIKSKICNDIDPCTPNPCMNHGSCSTTGNKKNVECRCAPGFTGNRCQTNIDECLSNPCEHESTCTDLINGYRCTCLGGFTGAYCQNDINECLSLPCQNGADCVNLVNTHQCHCTDGYTGSNCQSNIDECISSPCMHGGRCIDLVNGFMCTCKHGYAGLRCETNIDECSSSPCYNNGTCVDQIASWTCACVSGYNGIQCQSDIDECLSNPCRNNGSCVDLVDGYKCLCPNDTNGDNCEIWRDHCVSGPCLNGGYCSNEFGDFSCHCLDPWFGNICENNEINRTEVCTDLEYTDCSCYLTTLTPLKAESYIIESGLAGLFTGILGTILYFTLCNLLGNKHATTNKVNNKVSDTAKNDILTVTDLDGESSTSCKNDDNEENGHHDKETERQQGCDCFVDHTGYDHFKRFDERLRYKYRFHKHKCRNNEISKANKK